MIGGFKIVDYGDQAISVIFGNDIDETINNRVTNLYRVFIELNVSGVVDLVPTYCALTVKYDSRVIRYESIKSITTALINNEVADPAVRRHWRVPVAYGGKYGIDLADLASQNKLSVDEVIAIHSSCVYRVYMIGFLPGFAYLGGLDSRLFSPRKSFPRASTPEGSINIGGQQTAIASVSSPSGWNLIGRTPIKTFQPSSSSPFVFNVGDEVTFESIPHQEFSLIAKAYINGDYQLNSEIFK